MGAAGMAFGGIGGMGTMALSEPATAATSGTVIDNFDDGDMSEYSVYREGPAVITSSPTYSGAGALKIDGTSTDCVSMSGLNSYPSAGDTFSVQARWSTNANAAILAYGVQTYVEYSDQEYYYVVIDPDNDDLALKKVDTNGVTGLEKNYSVGLTADTWHKLEVEWATDGTHTVTLYDDTGAQVTQLSASDSTWTDGGIGFFGREINSGGTVYFDEAEMSSPPAPKSAGLVIDRFEDSDMDEYSVYREGPAIISSDVVYAGGGALEIDGTSTDCVSMSGLPHYPEAGDTFSVKVRWTQNANALVLAYGVQQYQEYSDQEYYYAKIEPDNDDVALKRSDLNGVTSLGKNYSVGLSPDTWYEFEIDWATDGTHTVTVYEETGAVVTRLTASDSTWNSGGIGFFGRETNSGATVYFDEATIGPVPPYRELVAENFTNGIDRYTVDQGSATVVESPAISGSSALKIDGTDTRIYDNSTTRLEPEQGDTLSCWIRGKNGADELDLAYALQSDDVERYVARVDVAGDSQSLFRVTSSGTHQIASGSVGSSLAEDTWYRLEVDWRRDGEHVFSIHDDSGEQLSKISGTDGNLRFGGYGFEGYLNDSGGVGYFDQFTILETDLPDDVEITNTGSSTLNYSIELGGEGRISTRSPPAGSFSDELNAGQSMTYATSGDIQSVENSDIKFTVDWTANEVTVEDLSGTSPEYTIEVTGTLSTVDSNNSAAVSNGTASGTVSGSTDVFSYSGDLLSFAQDNRMSCNLLNEISRLVENPHPNRPVADIAMETAKDPHNNRIAFTSTALDDTKGRKVELYLATGVSSVSEVPDEIFQVGKYPSTATSDIEWTRSEGLRFWRGGFIHSQRVDPGADLRRSIPVTNEIYPGANGGGN